jgi:hypothetical protein
LYQEFEKYCRSDTDFWKRIEEENQYKQSMAGQGAKVGTIKNRAIRYSISIHSMSKTSKYLRRTSLSSLVPTGSRTCTKVGTRVRNRKNPIVSSMVKIRGTTPRIAQRLRKPKKG